MFNSLVWKSRKTIIPFILQSYQASCLLFLRFAPQYLYFSIHSIHPFCRSVDVPPPFLGLFVPFCLPFLPASGLLGDQSSWRTLIRGNRTAMFTLICVPAKRKRQFNMAVSTLVEQMQGNEMQREQVTTCWQKVRAQWSWGLKQTSLMQRDYSLCRECETSNTWFWI